MSPADSLFASLPAAPGPHPALAELRAYAAGALAPAEQHRIEAHALDCERCADVLAGLVMSDAGTTNQAVATLRTRLQARVRATPPVAAPNWWPRIAAAAALLGVVAGGVWTWEQRPATSGTVAASLPATAHLETAAPSAPTAAPAPSTAAMPPPAPAAAPPADYAAAPPPPPLLRPGRLRSPARPAVGDLTPAEQPASFEETDAVLAADAETAAPGSASVAAAPVAGKQLVTELSKKEVMADSAVGARPGTLAGGLAAGLAKARVMRAKSAPATGAAAYVAATPMPAGPALAPAPVGGTPALRAYLSREAAAFLPEPNSQRLTGTVRVRLVVGADGKITQLQITRGLRPDYDAEALRIVCEGPAWQPGVAGGQRAVLPVELAVPF